MAKKTTKVLGKSLGKLLLSLLFLLNLLFLWPEPVVAAQERTTYIYPASAHFTSSSTDNGHRHFLAMGNFFDTTNSAYFSDSQAYLEFNVSELKQYFIKDVQLQIYKYANAFSGNVSVEVNKDGVEQIATFEADNGDNDYDEINIDLKSLLGSESQLNIDSLKLQFGVTIPSENEGIAACSGNFINNICPQKYFPKLLISYQENIPAQLKSLNYDKVSVFNAKYSSEFVKCEEYKGCKFAFKYHLEDKEGRAILIFTLKSPNSVNTLNANRYNSENMLEISLSDGEYLFSYRLQDLGHSSEVLLGKFIVDTTPPAKVEIMSSPQYSNNEGGLFEFAEIAEENVEVKAQICEFYDGGVCIGRSGGATALGTQKYVTVQASKPLLSSDYYFVFASVDRHGNTSEQIAIKLPQKNDYENIVVSEIKSTVISPANQDGKYDAITVRYRLPLVVANHRLEIKDSKDKIVQTINLASKWYEFEAERSIDITGEVAGRFLADGKYYLEFNGEDISGYPIYANTVRTFVVDNTPPKLF